MGLRAVVHADNVAARASACAGPPRLSCCLLMFLWPSAPDHCGRAVDGG